MVQDKSCHKTNGCITTGRVTVYCQNANPVAGGDGSYDMGVCTTGANHTGDGYHVTLFGYSSSPPMGQYRVSYLDE
jgi:hypothetical protein